MVEDKVLLLFGSHVKKVRLSQNLSQDQLANLCELDRTYISGIERGKRNLSLINIVKLANSLSITPSELMDFKENKLNG